MVIISLYFLHLISHSLYDLCLTFSQLLHLEPIVVLKLFFQLFHFEPVLFLFLHAYVGDLKATHPVNLRIEILFVPFVELVTIL